MVKKRSGQTSEVVATPLSLSRSLELVGDPWALSVLRQAFLGVSRFQDFQSTLEIPRQTLVSRLNRFTENAIVYKQPGEYGRLVYEYHLTPKGLDLYHFVLMIWRWHKRWHLDESILPAKLYHRHCGQLLNPVLRCRACDGEVVAGEVDIQERNVAQNSGFSPSARRSRILNEWEKLGDDLLATVVLGDSWSISVLEAVLRGVENYDAIQRSLGISSNVLSTRLKSLLSLQLLEQQANTEDGRKLTYSATKKGRDIFPIIVSLIHWGDRWLAGPNGPPNILRHVACGEILTSNVCCSHCNERIHSSQVTRSRPVV